MKKYLFLLVVPFLFFSVGCDDDDSDDTIPVSEYSESILGHWEKNSSDIIITTKTQIIQIHPVYGTETVQEFISTNNWEYVVPDSLFIPIVLSEFTDYYTYKYDGTFDLTQRNLFINTVSGEGEEFVFFVSGNYELNENYINFFGNDFLTGIYNIQDFTNSSFTLNYTTIDTTEIVNNSYSIIETSTNSFFERIEESDIPISN